MLLNEELKNNNLTLINYDALTDTIYRDTNFSLWKDKILTTESNITKPINRFSMRYKISKKNSDIAIFDTNIDEYLKKVKKISINFISDIKRLAKNSKDDQTFIENALNKIDSLYNTKLHEIERYDNKSYKRSYTKSHKMKKIDISSKEKLTSVTFDSKSSVFNITIKKGFNNLYRAFTGDYHPLSLAPNPGLGRLNKKGEAVFYLSMSPNTPKNEVPNWKYIYQYEVIKPITLQISFGAQFNSPIYDEATKKVGKIITKIFNQLFALKSDNQLIQNRYYLLTNEIMNKYIKFDNIDGIIYPTVHNINNEPYMYKKNNDIILNTNIINLILFNGKEPSEYLKPINRISNH